MEFGLLPAFGSKCGFPSLTPLILLKHLHRHGIPQLSHHLDGSFTLMADMIARPPTILF
jgi:hypothetical protein